MTGWLSVAANVTVALVAALQLGPAGVLVALAATASTLTWAALDRRQPARVELLTRAGDVVGVLVPAQVQLDVVELDSDDCGMIPGEATA